MKKLGSVLLVVILMTACFAGLGSAMAEEKLNIGFVFSNANADSYHTAHYNESIRYAEEQGVNLMILDPGGDIPTQITQVEDLVEQGVDALMVWAVDVNAIVPAVKKAYDAGIPVIVNMTLTEEGMQYVTCYVGEDNREMGRLLGEAVVNHFADAGKESVKVVEIAHRTGLLAGQQRAEGFRKGLEGSNVEIIESHSCEGSRETATQLMEGYISKYGADGFDVVFSHGNSYGIGILNAIRDANLAGRYVVTGIAHNMESYERLLADELTYDIVSSPVACAQKMIEVAIRAAKGEPVEAIEYVPLALYTKDYIETNETDIPTW